MKVSRGIGFKQALRALREERRPRSDPHLSLEELEAYHRGALSEDRQERVAEHLGDCEDCTNLLLHGVIGQDRRRRRVGVLEAELEEIWSKLVSHLEAITASGVGVDDRIESLYEELIAMTREARGVAGAHEIERKYARLLELQMIEAEQFRERFEASLEMPIDAGEKILARARALREELENIAASDAAA